MADSNDIKLKFNTSYDGKGAREASSSIQRHWADIKAKFDLTVTGIKAGWNAMTSLLEAPFKFETQTNQFKVLIGDIDKAKSHMADLKRLGDTPPFSLDQFAAASRSLIALTDGSLGYRHSLELIGDAAAATGAPLESLSSQIGYLYACIRDGEPIERATRQLSRMGVISPETATELSKLQKEGASGAEIWASVEKALGKYSGAMKESETTGAGLMAAIQTRWDNIVRKFGDAFAQTAKNGLGRFLEYVKNLEDNGTLEKWAEKTKAAIGLVVEAAKAAVSIGQKLVQAYAWVQDSLEKVGAAGGAMVGALTSGASVTDAWDAAGNAWNDTAREQADRAKEAADQAAQAAEHAATRTEQAAKDAAVAVTEESKRIADDLSKDAKRIEDEEEKREEERIRHEESVREFILACNEEMRRREEEAWEEAEKNRLEAHKKAVEDQCKDELAQIDDMLKDAAKKRDEWEKEAKKDRGKAFFEAQRDRTRERHENANREYKARHEMKKAQDEIARLEKDEGSQRMNQWKQKRLDDLRAWRDAQNPANNPFQNQIDQLQQKRDELQKREADDIAAIKEKLKSLGLK